MPARVYSERFYGPAALPTLSSSVLYTVPSGYVAVVRFIAVVNFSVTASTVVRVAVGSAATASNRWYRRALPAEAAFFEEVRIPLKAGEFLSGFQDASVSGSITLSGFLFVEG